MVLDAGSDPAPSGVHSVMTDTPDQDLVQAMRRGDEHATTVLFRRAWPGAWRAAYALTGSRAAADDIAQDAFERALRSAPDMNGSGSFDAWLKRVAVNRAIDVLRKEGRRRRSEAPDRAEPEWVDDTPVDPVMVRAISALEPDRRVPLVLHYWLGYTQPQVAELLGVPLGTVSSRISRALTDLREALGVTDG